MPELFWQYPVITEKVFSLQNTDNESYVAMPWATIIDKRIDLNKIKAALQLKTERNRFNITCCQHIYFKKLIPFFKEIGINVLYTPHKVLDEDVIDGIIIKPCPLYAVNVEDERKNDCFKNINYMNRERRILYSFQGAYQEIYISKIRLEILKLQSGSGMGLKIKPEDVYVKNIGEWHFNNTVYSDAQSEAGEVDTSKLHERNTTDYNHLLIDSTFSLCPSGSGPNSIRFWEALATGSIPILLSDKLDLPYHPMWNRAIVRIPESQVKYLDTYLRNMSKNEVSNRRKMCLDIYGYFKDNFINSQYDGEFSTSNTTTQLVHYCCGSYDIGDYGGVARYDYHLKKVYKHRRFFKGPAQKNCMLQYSEKLRSLGRSMVIITDNHLACDIPNHFKVFIVHHGCARKTAQLNPDWDLYWRDLCVKGQDNMLEVRDPNSTEIISISREVKEDFRSFYGTRYSKFNNHLIHHTSDFDEDRFKIYSTSCAPKLIQVLGNFGGKKGDINVLKQSVIFKASHSFNQLDIKGHDYSDVVAYNKAKQDIYLSHDIFLQISNSEGFSYAALDAAICGMVVVSTPVGFFSEVPDDCYVKIDINKRYDVGYLENKLAIAWINNAVLSKNLKNWYQKNCTFSDWENKMKFLINK